MDQMAYQGSWLTLSLLDQVMVRKFVTLTFYSVNKILSCYHSNETSLAELLHRTIYFLGFYETKFRIFAECFALATLGVKGLNAFLY